MRTVRSFGDPSPRRYLTRTACCSNQASSIDAADGGARRQGGDGREGELLGVGEGLALLAGGERAPHLGERALERVDERHEARLGREASEHDQHRGFARREVHRRQRVRAVERVPASGAALGLHGERRVAQGVEVPVDGAHRHAEALGELLGGDARPPPAEVLGEREEAGLAAHRGLPRGRAGRPTESTSPGDAAALAPGAACRYNEGRWSLLPEPPPPRLGPILAQVASSSSPRCSSTASSA